MTQMTTMGSGAMFDNIAARYDLLNRILSFGLDHSWRRRALRRLSGAMPDRARILDLATGTGDAALYLRKRCPDAEVIGVDPSANMLEIARQKALGKNIEFALGDAEHLDFPPGGFDGACICFGIRNVPDRAKGLAEVRRVMRPGGRLSILELSEPGAEWYKAPARFYIHHVMPRVGALLSGSREYRYLQESIQAFPPPAEFQRLLEESGFESAVTKPLLFGIAHVFEARAR